MGFNSAFKGLSTPPKRMTDNCNRARYVAVLSGYKSQLFERSWFLHPKTQQFGKKGLPVPVKRGSTSVHKKGLPVPAKRASTSVHNKGLPVPAKQASTSVDTRPTTRCHIPQQFNLQRPPSPISALKRTKQRSACGRRVRECEQTPSG